MPKRLQGFGFAAAGALAAAAPGRPAREGSRSVHASLEDSCARGRALACWASPVVWSVTAPGSNCVMVQVAAAAAAAAAAATALA
eukprot:scaffold15507_cov49-Phaeocystis_antarctica.AAC.3